MACMSRGGMMMEEPTRNPSNVGVNARGSHTVNHGYMPGHTAVDALFKDKMNANTNTKHFPSGMYFQNWGKEEIGPKTLCSSNMESDSRLETDIDGVWAILNSLKNFDVEDAVMVVKYSKKGTKVRIVRGQTDDFMLDTLGKESMMPFGNDGSTSNPLFYDALATNSVEGVRSTTDMMATGRTQQGSTQMNRGSHNQDNSFGLQVSFDQPGSQQRTSSGGFEQESEPPRAIESGKLTEDKPNVTGNITPTRGESFFARFDLVQQTDTQREGEEFKFECKACGKLFSDPFFLHIHRKMHAEGDQNAFLTNGCPSSTRLELQNDSAFHGTEKTSACLPSPMCGKTFTNESSLQQDVSDKTCEKPLNCSTLGKALLDASLLSSNTKTHTDMKAFQCWKCEKVFSTKIALQSHMSGHLKLISFEYNEGPVIHTDTPPFKCHICGAIFDRRSSLVNHRKSHLEESVQESPRNQSKFVCFTCGKTLTSLADLSSHNKTHRERKSNECEMCGKVFSNRRYLIRHQKTHLGLRPFVCSTCSKAFTTQAHLRGHVRTHTGEKPFVCSTCGRSFNHLSACKTHERTHTGEKPYTCRSCEKSFGHLVSLRNHINKIHKHN